MESSNKQKRVRRERRAQRLRATVRGTAAKPRLCVVKSNAHLYAQLIDDEQGVTLASVSTLSKAFRDTEFNRKNRTSAEQLGKKIAELAKAQNIEQAVFDRGAAKYHGVLAALADAAREAGLKV